MSEVPRLRQVNIAVDDMNAMAAFYERLGLPLAAGHPDWTAHHRSAPGIEAPDVELDSVAFTSSWNEGWHGGTGVVLGFEVDDRNDVDRLYAELTAAGASPNSPPTMRSGAPGSPSSPTPTATPSPSPAPPDPAQRTPPPPPPGAD